MVPWGFYCIKPFLADVAIALSTFSVQRSPATRGHPSLQGDAEACSDTNPAQEPAAPWGAPDFGCTGGLRGLGGPSGQAECELGVQCTVTVTAVTKANQTRGGIHRDTLSRNTDVIVPLSSVLFQITPDHLLVPIAHKKKMLMEWKGAKRKPQG